jgi:hypothetical protein
MKTCIDQRSRNKLQTPTAAISRTISCINPGAIDQSHGPMPLPHMIQQLVSTMKPPCTEPTSVNWAVVSRSLSVRTSMSIQVTFASKGLVACAADVVIVRFVARGGRRWHQGARNCEALHRAVGRVHERLRVERSIVHLGAGRSGRGSQVLLLQAKKGRMLLCVMCFQSRNRRMERLTAWSVQANEPWASTSPGAVLAIKKKKKLTPAQKRH